MKRCPKCGTYNPDTETRCTSCDAKLPENTVQPITAKATTTPKRCPVCGFVNEPGVHRCVKCDARIDGSRPPVAKVPSNYGSKPSFSGSSHSSYGVDTWMYVISFLIPIVGIILGIVYVSQGRSDDAKGLFIAGILGIIIGAVLSGFVSFCYMSSLR